MKFLGLKVSHEHALLLRSFGIDCETILDTKVRTLQPNIGPLLRSLMVRGDVNVTALLEDTEGFVEQLQVFIFDFGSGQLLKKLQSFFFLEIIFDGIQFTKC